MDLVTMAAASGMRARMEALEMLANNLANAATPGFKLDQEGYSLYVAPEPLDAAASASAPDPVLLPVIQRNWTDFRQAPLLVTGNPTDLAISGRGFFAIEGPKGPLYTRNGAFRISRDGGLVTAEGYAVRAAGGGTIQLVGNGPLEVSSEGEVRQNGQLLGRLEIVDFPRLEGLIKQGRNYFRPFDPSLAPVAATGYAIEQGKLEASNVSTPEAAVRLISILRQFEMLQRAVALGSEMNRRAIEELAKVNP